MKVLQEGLNFCTDCMIYAVNNDLSGLDYYLSPEESEKREKAIKEGFKKLNGYPVMTGDEYDFSDMPCSCCGETLRGTRFIFNLIGD